MSSTPNRTASSSDRCSTDSVQQQPDSPALLLDLDGTLLELAPRPDEVTVPAHLPLLLESLHALLDGALAMVSGRSIASIDALLGEFRSPASGLHGAELRASASSATIDTVKASSPHTVIARVPALHLDSHRFMLEDKGACVAIHHRLDAARMDELRAEILSAIAGHAPDLDLLEGRCVLEIKPRAVDKGEACRRLLSMPAFSNRYPIYLGDDVTDIDAFRHVQARGGLSIAVGPRVPRHAEAHLPGPSAVWRWLCELRQRLERSNKRSPALVRFERDCAPSSPCMLRHAPKAQGT